jgi:hypothetical protein
MRLRKRDIERRSLHLRPHHAAFVALLALGTSHCRQVLGIEEPVPREDARDCESGETVLLQTVTTRMDGAIALKNVGECDVDLSRFSMFFDDHEDGVVKDCLLALPDVLLLAGRSVRLAEGALSNDLRLIPTDACESIPVNSSRGNRTYLCLGACGNNTVMDSLAHAGTSLPPPEALWGTRFADPLDGIGDTNFRDSYRYQRRAHDGRPPVFVDTDWGLQRRTLFADVEDGSPAAVTELGETITFDAIEGPAGTFGTSLDDSKPGSVSSLWFAHTGEAGSTRKLTYSLRANLSPNPLAVSYFAKVSTWGVSAAHFEFVVEADRGRLDPVMRVTFAETGLGADLPSGERAEVPYVAGTWYQVELRDIDWEASTFDLYVDRLAVGVKLPFLTPASAVDALHIYSASGESTAYVDDIEAWADGIQVAAD